MCAYDKSTSGVSDCQSRCGAECGAKVGNGHCDAGRFQSECLKAECGWDMGDCGICDVDCRDYLGPVELIGDGQCHSACNTQLCDFDGGDCFDESRPYEVYVSSSTGFTANGSWDSPYRSFSQTPLFIVPSGKYWLPSPFYFPNFHYPSYFLPSVHVKVPNPC